MITSDVNNSNLDKSDYLFLLPFKNNLSHIYCTPLVNYCVSPRKLSILDLTGQWAFLDLGRPNSICSELFELEGI